MMVVRIENVGTGNLRQQVISGLSWMTLSQFAQQVLQFAISVILARLLTPRDFGLVALITVFTGFATLLGGLGLGTALIQHDHINEQHLSTVFWINAFSGTFLTLVFMVAAPAIAAFYGEPLLVNLTRVMSLNFILTALTATQATIIRRSMNFRLLAIRDMLGLAVSGACGIALALAGFGVWSLVWRMLIGSFCMLILLWTANSWRPRLEFHPSAVAPLLGYSSNMLGANVLQYWTRNLDNLLVGKFLGSIALGLYSRAYTIMLLPLTQVTFVLQTVMFPALSRVQHEHARVKNIYLRVLSIIALLTFPLMCGLFVVADEFVMVLFTEKWADMIPTLRILCLVGLVQSLTSSTRWIYASQGRTDWMLRWGLFSTAGAVLSFVPGIMLGSLEILAAGYAAANLMLLYWDFNIPGRLIGLTFEEVVRNLSGITACTVVMSLIVLALKLIIPHTWPAVLTLVAECLLGGTIYLGLIHLLGLPAYREARTVLAEQWQHTIVRFSRGPNRRDVILRSRSLPRSKDR